jgi:hypothetical protein
VGLHGGRRLVERGANGRDALAPGDAIEQFAFTRGQRRGWIGAAPDLPREGAAAGFPTFTSP